MSLMLKISVTPNSVPHTPHPHFFLSSSMDISRLAPNLIGNLADEGKLLLLVLLGERVAALVGAEAALWADGNALQGFLAGLAAALGHKVCGLVDPPLHLLLVLQLAQLGGDGADYDVPVLGEELEGLESARSLGVVLEVESVDLELGEEGLGDDVVGALGKVPPTDEVSATEVNAGVEVGGQLANAVIVQVDVGVEEVVDSANVVTVLGEALAETVGAKVCEAILLAASPQRMTTRPHDARRTYKPDRGRQTGHS